MSTFFLPLYPPRGAPGRAAEAHPARYAFEVWQIIKHKYFTCPRFRDIISASSAKGMNGVKKVLCILLACAAALTLAACGDTTSASTPTSENEAVTTPSATPTSGASAATESPPAVYMTTDISADGLVAVYEALGAEPSGRIAVKLSTGEPGSNYLRPELIGELVQSFDEPTIAECNTAYGGSRANTAMHYQVAEDHGYTDLADVDIMDEDAPWPCP